MPAVPPTPRVKHRAATRRVPRSRTAEAETSTVPDAEPNMRLSRAILVMLLLHVVAVGGILAFSLIKERGSKHPASNSANNAVEAEDSDPSPTKVEGRDSDRPANDTPGTLANSRQPRSGESLTRVANDPTNPNPPVTAANDAAERIAGGRANNGNGSAPAPTTVDKNGRLPADSGKTYVVRKGDSPYTIADRLKVDASALLKLNGIDDPKKLRPGQTLHVPAANHGKTK